MRTDIYGQFVYNEVDLLDLYYNNPDIQLKKVLVDDKIEFDSSLGLNNLPNLVTYIDNGLTIEQFDNLNQNVWHMPKEYMEMDIAQYILDKCKTETELQRAGKELLMFQDRNMFTLLKYLKYLVDTMRENNIVWGVGRGSSVASFVLYLLEIHRINSLYYDLEIEEFLK